MAGFALITFKNEKKVTISPNKFIKIINYMKIFLEKLFHIFRRLNADGWIDKVDLYDDLHTYVIKLPYKIEELGGLMGSRVEKAVFDVCRKYSINSCLLPDYLPEGHRLGRLANRLYSGKLLYKSLVYNVLEEICERFGVEASGLDITIISGSDNKELYTFIMLLAPFTKYITVLVKDRESVQDEINKIYCSTGLSVGLTTDYKNGIKNAGVIINLGDINRFGPVSVINRRTWVINYGEKDNFRLLDKNIVVNGIKVKFPQHVINKLDKNTLDSFNMVKLAEMILVNRLSPNNGAVDFTDDVLMRKVSEKFRDEGFRVSIL
jgi:hypothetical protein